MDQYFSPSVLRIVVVDILSNMVEPGNTNIVNLDEDLQIVFDTWQIYMPNLMQKHILPHVIAAPQEIADEMTNKIMTREFHVETPYNILYKDPTSLFWIHPVIDFMIHKSTGNTKSWKKTVDMFVTFCSNPNFFIRSGDFVHILPNTPLVNLFAFKFFHVSQIEQILTDMTKFLGRKNGIYQSCPSLKYNYKFSNIASFSKYNNIFTWIDDIVNNNNPYLPTLTSECCI